MNAAKRSKQTDDSSNDSNMLDEYRKALHQNQLQSQRMVNDAREQHNLKQWKETVGGSAPYSDRWVAAVTMVLRAGGNILLLYFIYMHIKLI